MAKHTLIALVVLVAVSFGLERSGSAQHINSQPASNCVVMANPLYEGGSGESANTEALLNANGELEGNEINGSLRANGTRYVGPGAVLLCPWHREYQTNYIFDGAVVYSNADEIRCQVLVTELTTNSTVVAADVTGSGILTIPAALSWSPNNYNISVNLACVGFKTGELYTSGFWVSGYDGVSSQSVSY